MLLHGGTKGIVSKAVNVTAVAKAAGVSALAVSRVFNNNTDIAPETAERVRKEAHRQCQGRRNDGFHPAVG
jgi:hypothetical protein